MRHALIVLATTLIATLCPAAQRKPLAAPAPARVARAFHDVRNGFSFQVPAEWDLNRRDGEVSTFALDARSSIKTTQLRAVANVTFKSFPTIDV